MIGQDLIAQCWVRGDRLEEVSVEPLEGCVHGEEDRHGAFTGENTLSRLGLTCKAVVMTESSAAAVVVAVVVSRTIHWSGRNHRAVLSLDSQGQDVVAGLTQAGDVEQGRGFLARHFARSVHART